MNQVTEASTILDVFRSLFAFIDFVSFWLLSVIYQVFYVLANTKFLNAEILSNFQSRIQLLLGVFMLFKLSVSVIEGLIEPDKFAAKKTGAGSIIVRILTTLVMLSLLLPLSNIQEANCNDSILNMSGNTVSYNCQLKNNGVLFGILYSFQDRILARNTLGKLVFGDSAAKKETSFDTISDSGNNMANSILKGFVQISKTPGSDEYVCEGTGKVGSAYSAYNSNARENLLGIINIKCEKPKEGLQKYIPFWSNGKLYAFSYIPIIGTVIALAFCYILITISVDVAIRVLKLGILQLIAPIPIISYIDPKQNEKGAFGSWVKTTTSTYLDLFIYLASVYFAIYLVGELAVQLIDKGILASQVGVFTSVIVFAIIAFGIYKFAAQAPKFVKQALGIKDEPGGFGSFAKSLNNALIGGAAGAIENYSRSVVGEDGVSKGAQAKKAFWNSFKEGYTASEQARAQGKIMTAGQARVAAQDKMAQLMTGDKDARGGIWAKHLYNQEKQLREMTASSYGIGNKDKAKADAMVDSLRESVTKAQTNADALNKKVKSMQTNGRMRNKADFAKDLANSEQAKNLQTARDTYIKMQDAGGRMMDVNSFAKTLGPNVVQQRDEAKVILSKLGSDTGQQKTKEEFIKDYESQSRLAIDASGNYTEDFDKAYSTYQQQYDTAKDKYDKTQNYINDAYKKYRNNYDDAEKAYQNANEVYDAYVKDEYAAYEKEYNAAVDAANAADATLAAEKVKLEKADKNATRIDKERAGLQLSPSIDEVEAREGFRTPYKVKVNEETQIPVDENGNEIHVREVILNQDDVDLSKHTQAEVDAARERFKNEKEAARKEAEDQYVYYKKLKGYDGSLDEQTMASLNGGRPQGPPPGP